MDITRRNKYKSNNGQRKNVKTDLKIEMNFDLNALDLMSSYILSENRNIRRSHLINMRNLFDIIDFGPYQNDIERMKRVNFIRKGLEARLERGIKHSNLILKYINGGLTDENLIDIGNVILSGEELTWINETISAGLKYAFIYNDIDKLIDVATRFKAADYRNRGEIVEEIEQLVNEMQTKFRRAKAESVSEMTFSLRQGYFEEVVADIHEQLSNPSRMLRTGMQGLNELLGGGFESSRVYMFLGLTGVGKSLTLLDIAYQLKKYNKDYKPKDPTKIPVVLYMTMENTVRETVQRLFTMSTGKESMTNYSVNETIEMLKREGELYLSGDSPIDIIIKFVPDKSVDTGYLYTMVEDLEDEGYEVICLIQDHIKRIRSCYKQPDIRLELGEIVNQFKVFCSLKDIPLITNSHLNRDAAKTIDEGSRANKADLTRMLGRSNIGESMLMLDNLDGGFIIQTEYDGEGNKFMCFQRCKIRYKASQRDLIYQPFIPGNDIRLIEDVDLAVPVFKTTLREQPKETGEMFNTGITQSPYINNIGSIDDIKNKNIIEEENIFSSSRYSSNNIEITEGKHTEVQETPNSFFKAVDLVCPITINI